MSEHRGLTHWAVYTDGSSLLAWNIVLNTPVRKILKDLSKVTAMAVDSCRGFIFLVSQISSKTEEQLKPQPKSIVTRYRLFVELPLQNEDGGILVPLLRVDPLSKQQVFEGNLVSAITVDED